MRFEAPACTILFLYQETIWNSRLVQIHFHAIANPFSAQKKGGQARVRNDMIVLRKWKSFCFSWTDLVSGFQSCIRISILFHDLGIGSHVDSQDFRISIFFHDFNLFLWFSQHDQNSAHFSRSKFPHQQWTRPTHESHFGKHTHRNLLFFNVFTSKKRVQAWITLSGQKNIFTSKEKTYLRHLHQNVEIPCESLEQDSWDPLVSHNPTQKNHCWSRVPVKNYKRSQIL